MEILIFYSLLSFDLTLTASVTRSNKFTLLTLGEVILTQTMMGAREVFPSCDGWLMVSASRTTSCKVRASSKIRSISLWTSAEKQRVLILEHTCFLALFLLKLGIIQYYYLLFLSENSVVQIKEQEHFGKKVADSFTLMSVRYISSY